MTALLESFPIPSYELFEVEDILPRRLEDDLFFDDVPSFGDVTTVPSFDDGLFVVKEPPPVAKVSARARARSRSRTRPPNDRKEGTECPRVKHCLNCNIPGSKTPQWRQGPDGPHSLCNACGVAYIKHRFKGLELRRDKYCLN